MVVVDTGTDGAAATMVTGRVTGGADVGEIEVAETGAPGVVGWSALPDVQPDAPTVDKTMIEAATRGCMGQRWSGGSVVANLHGRLSFEMFAPRFGSGSNRDHLCGYAIPRSSSSRPTRARQLRPPQTVVHIGVANVGVARRRAAIDRKSVV